MRGADGHWRVTQRQQVGICHRQHIYRCPSRHLRMCTELQKSITATLLKADRTELLDIIESSQHIGNQEEFFKWTQTELQSIFPHGKLICGVGRLCQDGVYIRHLLACNCPEEYVKTLLQPDGLTSSPIIKRWMKEQQPILFEPNCKETIEMVPAEWLANFHKFGLVNLAAHGLSCIDKHTASYFSFSCIPGSLNQYHAYLLKILVPHLHLALTRVVSNPRFTKKHVSTQQIKLSKREIEILPWISNGKSNWEIAQLFALSESTVKNHVHHILNKLQATTRAQAVTKAINFKLIRAKL